MSGREYLVEFVKRVSGASKPRQIIIPYYLLDICGNDYDAAALLNQILFWMDITKHPQKWYARSYEDIQKDLRLSKFRVMRVSKILKGLGVEMKSMISRYHKYARVVHWRMTDKAIETMLKKSMDDGILTSWSEETQLHDGLSNQETQLHEVKELNGLIDKSIEKNRKRKEELPSVATQQSAVSTSPDNWSLADEASDAAMFPIKGKKQISAQAENGAKRLSKNTTPPIPQIAPAPLPPLPPVSAAVLTETDESAVDVAAVLKKGKARKPNHTALVINAVWGKGVSGGLLPMLMGNAKKAPWKDHNIEGGMTEVEIFAFGRWYKKQNPGLNLVEQPPKVWAAITSFRDAIDYEGWMAEAEKLFPTYFPKEKPPAPVVVEERATAEDLAAFRRQILESGLQAELGHIVTSQENVS